MALETSPDSPAPLRVISQLMGDYIARLGAQWIEGEVAQLTRRQGVCFLTLRDLDAKISMSVTCRRVVLDRSSTPITEGARVVVHARPDFYPTNGSLSLNARDIRPVGMGELLARIEQRRQLLAAEGLFDVARKRPLPFLPHRIGLITGKGSAAEHDILENARLRWPGVEFVTTYALMQGNQAAAQVITALRELDADETVDVIVIARGGGSVEDLLPFSDEGLVRAVSAARTPVVSAIGHEPDTPLLDYVADVRASTPTDAAKRVVPAVADELHHLTQLRRRAWYAVDQRLGREQHGLDAIRSRPVLARPSTLIDEQTARVEDLCARARRSLGHRLDLSHHEVAGQLARVRSLSPLRTLERGYAVAQAPDGSVVTSIDQLSPDDEVTLRVVDGHARLRTLSTAPAPHADLDEES
ncbi:exodeoxyribonuclease VII large subunit [Mumia sp. zg.B53]|uniref:exodeoxyribonuclease VII large subunit n=1 Tax=unclassified Mumia TaxID=2621872 RepID=UPI001C6E58FA|nr:MULTISPECIES: exodeoxyribonuclease VII large subunit [unclassified Mumia]MBW9206847.1 exodeoxyribonuclease VII large subunit [Mumia sp. zg.B17]MBW9215431.1 exodeoxyribonuclease VII large subunit [Mumia sp. zg.B53]